MKNYSNSQIQEMLNKDIFIESHAYSDREEDLGIIQNDGSRSCIGWELAGRGFSVIDPASEKYGGNCG